MTLQDIAQYYANLLLLQYQGSQTVQTISTVADNNYSLNNTFFTMYDGLTAQGYIIGFNVGGRGGALPLWPPGPMTKIHAFSPYLIAIPVNSTASAVANALSATIATFSNFTPSVSGSVVTLTNNPNGPFAVAIDVTTGFSFSKNNAINTVEAAAAVFPMNQLATTIQNAFQLGSANWNNALNWSGLVPYNDGDQVYQNGIVYQSNFTGNQGNNPTNNPYYWTPIFQSAFGAQLDVLAKYAGVYRNGVGVYGQEITLTDSDFIKLITLGIATNNFGSSLQTIDEFLFTYFPNQIFAYDGENMEMQYLIAPSTGTSNFTQMAITQGLLPKPMGVALTDIFYPSQLGFFGLTRYSEWTVVGGIPVSNIPTWNSAITYSIGFQVVYQGVVYQSVTNGNLNNAVTNSTYWTAIQYPATVYNGYTNYNQTPAYTGNWKWLTYADVLFS